MTNQFPTKTALTVVTFVAFVAAYRRFAQHDKGIDASIFLKAATLHLPHPPQPKPAPLNHIQQPQVAEAPDALAPISPYLTDDSGALDSFYAALHQLELPPAPGPARVVTILHYGDSPTTADLITGDVRALLQARFGDAGHGALLIGKPWAWYGHRDTDISDHGWDITPATHSNREDAYGLGGARFEGGAEAGSHITLKGAGQTAVEVSYLASTGGGSVQVLADGVAVDSFSTAPVAIKEAQPMMTEQAAAVANSTTGTTPNSGPPVVSVQSPADKQPGWHTVALPATAKSIDLKPSGAVTLFDESFTTGRRGVLYDSLGLNGAFTSVLSSAMNPAIWGTELKHTNPALIVINYGTNESGFGPYVDKAYEATLRTTITRIRAALPNVAILIMSPMDRGKRSGVDEIETYDTIPRIVAIQQRVAAEQKCAFFDTFEAMGGDGTMSRWYTGHPRLVAGDLIHPTPQGAAMVGGLFVKDLLLGYDRWMKRQPQPPVQAAPKP